MSVYRLRLGALRNQPDGMNRSQFAGFRVYTLVRESVAYRLRPPERVTGTHTCCSGSGSGGSKWMRGRWMGSGRVWPQGTNTLRAASFLFSVCVMHD